MISARTIRLSRSWRLIIASAFALVTLVACGTAEPATPIEVTVEVETEVVREVTVIKEVEVEVIKEVTVEVPVTVESAAPAMESMRTLDEKMENAMSAGPAPIANEAAILDYPEEWPGDWPEAVAPTLPELRAGTNGWTCLVDRPDTPGNDPMCLNDVYFEVLMSQYDLVDAPSTGIGFGYMLQGGGPVGSPPHMMVFTPESNDSVNTHGTEPGPFPWIMFPETTQQHLMVLVTPPSDITLPFEDKIGNAMSAGPAPIAQEATILDYPASWPENWPDEVAPDLIELQTGSNGWTCLVDRPDTPGNDPMCLNDVYFDVLMSQYNLVDAPSTGIGFGYMLQGGGPVGSPPHMMVFAPESNASITDYGTDPGPFPWIMFPETTQQHLMVLTAPPIEGAAAAAEKIAMEKKTANAMSAAPAGISKDAAIWAYTDQWPGEWPDAPVPDGVFEELRSGTNGWTCIADIPTTPGNDPMCLNDVYLASLQARYNLVETTPEGIGFGYMLQGGGPVGSPPHMMYLAPASNANLGSFTTEPGPQPWIMFPETTHDHLMVLVTPPSALISAEEDPIANAMSAGPAAISQDATIWAYTDQWPGEWPDGPIQEGALEELQSGTNGWTCIADIPTTPGNDPMCINDVYLASLMARYALEDGPSEGIGFGYMLQGGGPVGSPPHMMYFVPESNASLDAFTTEPGPQPWIMFPDTTHQHLMVLTHVTQE